MRHSASMSECTIIDMLFENTYQVHAHEVIFLITADTYHGGIA